MPSVLMFTESLSNNNNRAKDIDGDVIIIEIRDSQNTADVMSAEPAMRQGDGRR